MKNIVTLHLYELLRSRDDVDMIENQIYIHRSNTVNNEGFVYPMKTDCTICCICLKGELKGRIDLKDYEVKAPALAISLPGQILEHGSYSADFDGFFIYMTKSFTESFNLLLGHAVPITIKNNPYIKVAEAELESIVNYCKMVQKILRASDNPYRLQIVTHLTIAYFYGIGHFLHKPSTDTDKSGDETIAEKFLQEVRTDFKKERSVEYYANKMQLSANYLSHVVKKVTGKTAGIWIDEYVALEAKALLKSTNMTVQQIADELNFPTQSFFGKFFKRMVGLAPKYYANENTRS